MKPRNTRRIAPIAAVAIAALVGCMNFDSLRAGQTEADVLRNLGAPTGRYAMPDGITRLEYATGPMGHETWMVDIDTTGHVRAWFQALETQRLQAFQPRASGVSVDELLRTVGRPGQRRGDGRGGELWTWRYPNADCLLFDASLGKDRRVVDAGFRWDPLCDGAHDREPS